MVQNNRLWAPELHDGSSEHYYHFLLGLVLPLVIDSDTYRPGTRTFVRSCGPLDSLLSELDLPGVTIISKTAWAQLRSATSHRLQEALGRDTPELYDENLFRRFRQAVMKRLDVEEAVSRSGVLIIDRGESPAFYQSDAVDNPTSANLRRSVPNMSAVYESLVAKDIPCLMKQLEATPLKEQVRMFLWADILVAQHGAGMVNMLWMRPGGRVIEILPEMGKFSGHFKQLATACGLAYGMVRQDARHSPVDIDAVVNLVLVAEGKSAS